jgi:hypothetical protein
VKLTATDIAQIGSSVQGKKKLFFFLVRLTAPTALRDLPRSSSFFPPPPLYPTPSNVPIPKGLSLLSNGRLSRKSFRCFKKQLDRLFREYWPFAARCRVRSSLLYGLSHWIWTWLTHTILTLQFVWLLRQPSATPTTESPSTASGEGSIPLPFVMNPD